MGKTVTVYKVTSEGRKRTFHSKESLDEYLKTTRPANDEYFEVVKETVETYTVKSQLPKATIDKTSLIDIVKRCADIIGSGYQKNCFFDSGVFYAIGLAVYPKLEDNELTDNKIKRFVKDWLMTLRPDDIDEFVYNLTDYHPCHNYMIVLDNLTKLKEYQDAEEKYDPRDRNSVDEFRNKENELIAKGHLLLSIQIRSDDVVFCWGHSCGHYGHHVHTVSTKKISFDSDLNEKLNEVLDKIESNI